MIDFEFLFEILKRSKDVHTAHEQDMIQFTKLYESRYKIRYYKMLHDPIIELDMCEAF